MSPLAFLGCLWRHNQQHKIIFLPAAIGSVTIPFVGTVAGSVVGGAVAGILLIAGYATSAWEIGGKYDACYNTAQIHYQQAKDKCADK